MVQDSLMPEPRAWWYQNQLVQPTIGAMGWGEYRGAGDGRMTAAGAFEQAFGKEVVPPLPNAL